MALNRQSGSIFHQLRSSRRGVSEWMSYVLLTGFAVVISVMMYHFMVDYTQSSTDDMKKVVYNTDECRLVSLNIDSACFSAQSLNITLENRNYVRIDSLDFRYYNGRLPLHINQTNISMNPNRVKTVSIMTGASAITMVEAIPHISKDNMDIICADKKASGQVSACT